MNVLLYLCFMYITKRTKKKKKQGWDKDEITVTFKIFIFIYLLTVQKIFSSHIPVNCLAHLLACMHPTLETIGLKKHGWPPAADLQVQVTHSVCQLQVRLLDI